jgi:hypothetical protein
MPSFHYTKSGSEARYAEYRGPEKLAPVKWTSLFSSAVSDEEKSFTRLAPGEGRER